MTSLRTHLQKDLRTSATDQYLVSEVLAGNKKAFDLLVIRYQSAVARVASVYTSDNASAQDIVQKTFVRTYRELRDSGKESSFYTWLCRIVIETSISHVKSRNISKNNMNMDEHPSHNTVKVEKTLSNKVDNQKLINKLNETLDMLPINLKIAFLLCEREGFKYQEIAQIIGVPVGTVKSRIFRSREALVKGLKGHI